MHILLCRCHPSSYKARFYNQWNIAVPEVLKAYVTVVCGTILASDGVDEMLSDVIKVFDQS